jgi:Arabinose efflux permease
VSDRYGRKRPLLIGIALYVLASLGCAIAASIDALMLWRLLQALGGCAGIVIARSMVRDLYAPVDAARVFSRLTLVLGAAPILAPLAGAALVQTWGWRAIFLVLSAFGVACLLAALALPESLAPGLAAMPSSTRCAMPCALISICCVIGASSALPSAGALGQSAMFAYIAGAPFVLMQVFGLSSAQFAWVFGANALGLIAASQINHALLARVGSGALLRRALLSLAVWASVMLALAVLNVGGFWGVVIPLFIALSSLGFSFPNATALALAHQTGRVGSAAALMGSLQFTLAAASGSAVGMIAAHSALPMAAVFCAFAGLALWANQRLAPR